MSGYDKSAIVIRSQSETAIYWNDDGDVVIRQSGWPDEDQEVIISRGSIEAVYLKLRDMGNDGSPA